MRARKNFVHSIQLHRLFYDGTLCRVEIAGAVVNGLAMSSFAARAWILLHVQKDAIR